jgi:hypothetical protein
VTGRQTNPWIAFAAGAAAILVLVLGWFAWQGRKDADEVARTAAAAAGAVPDLRPRLPERPHLPDAPIPVPK